MFGHRASLVVSTEALNRGSSPLRYTSLQRPFRSHEASRPHLWYSVGGILITLLQWTHYHFLIVEHSVEIYAALIAAGFAAFGIWLGSPPHQAQNREVVIKEVPVPATEPFVPDDRKREDLGITPRELDILVLIAKGMSNREIAEKLFVSENTVKTHSSRVFSKLGAKRRTQAVQLGKEFGLFP